MSEKTWVLKIRVEGISFGASGVCFLILGPMIASREILICNEVGVGHS
jgi:hypothetical protein